MQADVSIDVIVHATEDPERLLVPAERLLGVGAHLFEPRPASGHYENPITTLGARVSGPLAMRVISGIRAGLRMSDMSWLLGGAGGDGLYIRLDKQELARGRLALGGSGAVRIRIHTPVYGGSDAREAYGRLFGTD